MALTTIFWAGARQLAGAADRVAARIAIKLAGLKALRRAADTITAIITVAVIPVERFAEEIALIAIPISEPERSGASPRAVRDLAGWAAISAVVAIRLAVQGFIADPVSEGARREADSTASTSIDLTLGALAIATIIDAGPRQLITTTNAVAAKRTVSSIVSVDLTVERRVADTIAEPVCGSTSPCAVDHLGRRAAPRAATVGLICAPDAVGDPIALPARDDAFTVWAGKVAVTAGVDVATISAVKRERGAVKRLVTGVIPKF